MRVRVVVTKALRRIGKSDLEAGLDAHIAADVLSTLNMMMAQWEGRGLTYSHADMALDDEFPISDMHAEGVAAMLAIRISDDHAPEAATAQLRRDAAKGWTVLYGEFGPRPKSKFDGPTRNSDY